MLGIIIWVITIILVVAIGTGATKQIEEQFKNLSVNSIFVFPWRWVALDAEAVGVVESSPYVSAAAWFTQGNYDVNSDTYDGTFSVIGMTPSYLDVVNITVANGEKLDESDEKQKTVLLWRGIFEQLYPETEPDTVIWTTVIIKKKEYTIRGVLKKTWGWFGPLTFDDAVYMAVSTYEKYLDKQKPSLRISALVKDVDQVSNAVEDITAKLQDAYKLSSDQNGIRVIDAGSSVVAAQENAKTLSILLIGMATIVFIVSGIGIMNVMFASVAERTKEIGILKSIWANRSAIMRQFLLESSLLACIWSLIGVVFGEWIIALDVLWSSLPLVRSTSGDFMAIWFALVTGIFFWWYPAWRAARLDPVDALRS